MRVLLGAVALLVAAFVALPAVAQDADAMFQAGRFDLAERLYAAQFDADPHDADAALRLGEIALLGNRLGRAEQWLDRALRLQPSAKRAHLLLAEVFYRQDDFPRAADSLRAAAGVSASLTADYLTLFGPKLESFGATIPYRLEGRGESLRLPFVRTDPLPLIRVTVQGREAVFFIDTGAAEVILDTDFARELGVASLGSTRGRFAGDQAGEVGNGRLASLTLGGWTIHNLPVQMIPTRPFSESLGERIDGAIGTTLLSHFLSTLDYTADPTGGALVLTRDTAANRAALRQSLPAGTTQVPFWLAGDHFIVTEGRIDDLPASLMFVDTGLVGAGVNLTKGLMAQAGIVPDPKRAETSVGGGGTFESVPYTVGSVAIGTAVRHDVTGTYNGPLSWEESYGFHLSGMVGHEFFRHYALTLDFTGMQMILH